MNRLGKMKLRKNLRENDGQYKGTAEALERVMPFDTEGVPRVACSPAGHFSIKYFFSFGEGSQRKLSPSRLRQLLFAVQHLYIPSVEEGASWNDLLRGSHPGLD